MLNPKCKVFMEPQLNIFEQIELFYGGALVFALGSPAIPYKSSMLGVGHLKIIPSFIQNKDTVAYQFVENLLLPRHPVYDQLYMMFMYTFDPYTFEILEITPGFYSPETKHGVIFPAGLTYHNDEYIISYGEGDYQCKCMFISKTIIDSMLIPQYSMNVSYQFL